MPSQFPYASIDADPLRRLSQQAASNPSMAPASARATSLGGDPLAQPGRPGGGGGRGVGMRPQTGGMNKMPDPLMSLMIAKAQLGLRRPFMMRRRRAKPMIGLERALTG